ncbi:MULTISPECIES: OmpP1/FadL family transporter [Mesorhizobium]|uniref:Long-chain fatty acid transport protein n=1 Tax=Rhizobium loti TaxID=381 RepID=A0A8E3B3K8_RHILI|nr:MULTISPECIES: OmpP1/FadL family transporter [Mesorhizobium]AZO42973.1 transporter [Mesorhizobium sp. M7D.F.Ca.US.005.01.1.1]PWJ89547.1 long-chain fatty acid transport protein [Mesorhizobium loti]RUX95837.1 transporter [Mesorhizobium sp. M7D.F.Ca.US.004.01.2.1]RVA33706.1 transporter [Mesorhizobium sp. M7D.F.Ca.US.004.03.1.1]
MNNLRLKALLGAGCFSLALIGTAIGPAHAGGLERGGYDIDLLFDPAPFASDVGATYVMPQRDLKNAVDTSGGGLTGKSSARNTEGYWVPYVGFKASLGHDVDCLVDYSQPWGASSNPGIWNGSYSNINTQIKSNNYAGTCSYKMDVGKGQLRFIGGVFYQEVYGFKESYASPALGTTLGRVDLDSSGWGWRAGIAYEIPDIALRASLVYNSQVKLDNIAGTLNIGGSIADIYAPTESMPDSLELKLQSGIAPGWLAFGSIKWVNWSVLQSVPICSQATKPLGCTTVSPYPIRLTSLDLMYRDGWTVTAGIGHQFNEQWSGAAQISWDRGTSHGYGDQTDTWTFGGGVAYTPRPNIELRLAGAVGVLTSGHSGVLVDGNGYPAGTDVSYDFGNDLVTAISGGLKIKF